MDNMTDQELSKHIDDFEKRYRATAPDRLIGRARRRLIGQHIYRARQALLERQ
jgi:hypothetical protein